MALLGNNIVICLLAVLISCHEKDSFSEEATKEITKEPGDNKSYISIPWDKLYLYGPYTKSKDILEKHGDVALTVHEIEDFGLISDGYCYFVLEFDGRAIKASKVTRHDFDCKQYLELSPLTNKK